MKICKLSTKAEKDLEKLIKYHSGDFEVLEKEMEYYLIEPIVVDGNKIKIFTNYTPKLFRLRVNGIESYRIYFVNMKISFLLKECVLKKDSENVLKAL